MRSVLSFYGRSFLLTVVLSTASACHAVTYTVPADTLPETIGPDTEIYVRGEYSRPESPWVLGPADQSGSNLLFSVGGYDRISGFPMPIAYQGHFEGDLVANSGTQILADGFASRIIGDIELNGDAVLSTQDLTTRIVGDIIANDNAVVSSFGGEIRGDVVLNNSSRLILSDPQASMTGQIEAYGPSVVEMQHGSLPGSVSLNDGAELSVIQSFTRSGTITADASTVRLLGGSLVGGVLEADRIELNNGSLLEIADGFYAGLSSIVEVNHGSVFVARGRLDGPFRSEPYEPSIFVNDGGLLQVLSGSPSFASALVTGGGRAELSGNGLVLEALGGAEVDVSGGDHYITARSGAAVATTGGHVLYSLQAGVTARLSGGTFRQGNLFEQNSAVVLVGAKFRVGDVPVTALSTNGDQVTIQVPAGESLRGVLSDGIPFLLSLGRGDEILTVTLELAPLPEPPLGSPLLASQHPDLRGLREGRTLVVDDGAALVRNFRAAIHSDAQVLAGGVVNTGFESQGGRLLVNGGELRGTTYLYGGHFEMYAGEAQKLVLSSDAIGAVAGGTLDSLLVGDGTRALVSGGDIDSYSVVAGGELHLFGSGFSIDGVPIEGLAVGETLEITQRGVTVSASLANGELAEFPTDAPETPASAGIVDPQSVFTVTVVGYPGDFNYDGVVDAVDYTVWRDALSHGESSSSYRQADGDYNGVVDERDRMVWAANYGGGVQPPSALVPESSALGIALATACLFSIARRASC